MSKRIDSEQNKSIYFLTSFISSQKSYLPFETIKNGKKITEMLTPYDISILFIIARYCDMKLGFCCVKQENLARECRMSERKLRDRMKVLTDANFVFRYMSGKLYKYTLGEKITNISPWI